MTTTPAAEPTPRRTYLNERSPRPGASLLASAARLTSGTIKARQGTARQEWQKDAWDMFELVPELRFLAVTLANRLAQARLYVGRLSDDPQEAPIPIDDDQKLTGILDSIGPTTSLRKQMIARLGTNLFVPGEGWLAGIPRYLMPRTLMVGGSLAVQEAAIEPPVDPTQINIADLEWRMLSVDEVTTNGSDVQITMGPSTEEIIKVNPDHVILIRVWRPHPRRWWEADSPTRSLLPVLRELVGLTMHDGAEVDSRLAGAGILIIPQSLRHAMEADSGLSEDELRDRDLFMEALMQAMITPISDRSNASAVVPLIITAPDDACEKVRHLSFSGPLDQYAGERQDKVIRRLALGSDAPPELLLGTGGMNHWGAWLVLEDVVTTHLEPPLALICDALTTQFLWPVLLDQGLTLDEARRIVVWYDVSDLVVRPNRGTDAMALHGVGAIGDPALRAATGFEESDAPAVAPLPREVEIALEAVRESPSLLSDPGLPALVAQIRAVLAGDLSGPSGAAAPDAGPVAGGEQEAPADGEGAGPGDDVPQPVPGTAGAPAEVPGPGTITSGGLVPAAAVPDWMLPELEDARRRAIAAPQAPPPSSVYH